jgi:hypothetical protein
MEVAHNVRRDLLEQERDALGDGVGRGDSIEDDVDGRLTSRNKKKMGVRQGRKVERKSKAHHEELVDAVAGEEVAQQVVQPALHRTRELDPLLHAHVGQRQSVSQSPQ